MPLEPIQNWKMDRATIHQAATELFDQALEQENPLDWLNSQDAESASKAEALRLLSLHLSSASSFLDDSILQARATWQPVPLQPGSFVASRYRIQRLIGEGGMGEVYLVVDEELHQTVALKTLRPHLAGDPVALERFRREVLLLREIHHPNVIRILDFGRSDQTYFYTMEFLEGETLVSQLKTLGPMNEKSLHSLATDLLAALAAIHSLGIVHRDLKPANIFLTASNRTILMDFGIAIGQGQSTLTDANSVLGSLDYMSPEQLEGQDVSFRSDYYALGLLMHECLTGHLAFSGTSPVARAFRRLNEPASYNPFPGPVGRAIAACLEKDPAHRPANTEFILRLLAGHRPWPVKRLVLIFFTLVMILSLWLFLPRSKAPNPALAQHLKLAAQFATRRTAADLDNARSEFESALQLDRSSHEAWTGLAEVYSTISNFGFAEPKPTLRKAEEAAGQALQLAPKSGSAQAVQAYIVSLDLKKWRSADPLFRRAVELDPSQTRTRLWYSAYLGKLGRFDEAFAQLKAGLELDPGSMPLNHELSSVYGLARDQEASVASARNLIRLQPREPSSHLALCRALLTQGKLNEAADSCREALRQDNSNSGQAIYASVLAAQGKLEQARTIARKVESKTRNVSILCDLYQRIGETDRAITIVEKAFAEGDSTIQLLGHSPRFDGIKFHAPVQRILQSLGFTSTTISN